jgi:deoxyribodipyrimidine photolyase-like uncharacterized protein
MTTLTFDTLQYTERLRAAGVSEQQAKAEAEALRDALSQALDTKLASKSDINDVRADIAKLDKEMAVLKWMVGLVLAGVASQLLKTFFA